MSNQSSNFLRTIWRSLQELTSMNGIGTCYKRNGQECIIHSSSLKSTIALHLQIGILCNAQQWKYPIAYLGEHQGHHVTLLASTSYSSNQRNNHLWSSIGPFQPLHSVAPKFEFLLWKCRHVVFLLILNLFRFQYYCYVQYYVDQDQIMFWIHFPYWFP